MSSARSGTHSTLARSTQYLVNHYHLSVDHYQPISTRGIYQQAAPLCSGVSTRTGKSPVPAVWILSWRAVSTKEAKMGDLYPYPS